MPGFGVENPECASDTDSDGSSCKGCTEYRCSDSSDPGQAYGAKAGHEDMATGKQKPPSSSALRSPSIQIGIAFLVVRIIAPLKLTFPY
jgi:hypothetical protein